MGDGSSWRALAALVAVTVPLLLFGAPRYLASGTPLGDDASSHLAEVLHVADVLEAGKTDFWFDQVNLGYPMFLAYQPLPALTMGALVAWTRPEVDPVGLFKLSVVLLWAAMPFTWALGGRRMGLSAVESVALGLASVTVLDTNGFGLGLASMAVKGLYTQSWGMLVLPVALGSLWQALVTGEKGWRPAAAWLAAVVLCHVVLGLFAAIGAALMVLLPRPGLGARLRRALPVWAGALGLSAFFWVPLLATRAHQGGIPWKTEGGEGTALVELGRQLARGDLLDAGRVPWLTTLAALGLLVALRRAGKPLAAWLVMTGVVTILLTSGRATFGPAYDALPLHRGFEAVRYVVGIQAVGLFLAALAVGALASLVRRVQRLERWQGPAALVILCVFGADRARDFGARVGTFDDRDPALQSLVTHLASRRDGRFLCARPDATHMCLNLLPALARRPQLVSYGRGYHDTQSLYYAETFDGSPEAARLFNVSAVVSRSRAATPKTAATWPRVWSNGTWTVREMADAPGWFAPIRTPIEIVGDRVVIREVTSAVGPPLFGAGLSPRLSARATLPDRIEVGADGTWRAIVGDEAMPPGTPSATVVDALIARHRRPLEATVAREETALGEYHAVVDVNAADVELLLKVSHHPYWHAWVDAGEVAVRLVAPNFMTVSVPRGRHSVRFVYENPAWQKALLLAALAALIGAPVAKKIASARRRAPRREREGTAAVPVRGGTTRWE